MCLLSWLTQTEFLQSENKAYFITFDEFTVHQRPKSDAFLLIASTLLTMVPTSSAALLLQLELFLYSVISNLFYALSSISF